MSCRKAHFQSRYCGLAGSRNQLYLSSIGQTLWSLPLQKQPFGADHLRAYVESVKLPKNADWRKESGEKTVSNMWCGDCTIYSDLQILGMLTRAYLNIAKIGSVIT